MGLMACPLLVPTKCSDGVATDLEESAILSVICMTIMAHFPEDVQEWLF